MTFGQPSDFAIEAYHEPSGPEYGGFGRMCIYIHGTQIGDIRENHCSLFHIAHQFRELPDFIETLWDKAFVGLSNAEVFGLIDRAPSWEPFDFLTNTGEMFNDSKTFIVCRPDGQVQILYQFRDDTFGSGSCSIQSFRTVATAFVSWFDEQVRATAPPFFPINPFDPDEYVPDNRNA